MSKLLDKVKDLLQEHAVLKQYFITRIIRSDDEIAEIKKELNEKYGEAEIYLQLIKI